MLVIGLINGYQIGDSELLLKAITLVGAVLVVVYLRGQCYSAVGPTLFILYTNDTDQGIVSKIDKFADDCKLGKSMRSQEDVEVLRKDLERLGEWADGHDLLPPLQRFYQLKSACFP